jgi:uncharacterized protein YecA (UPF0149 family)
MQHPAEPLDEEQFARWQELARECGIDSVDFMHGVFCAAATPANKRLPTEWMPLLLRREPPSRQALVEFTRLCLAEYAVCEQLLDLEDPNVPEPDDVEGMRQFCRGYMVLAQSDDRWFKENSVFLATLPLAAVAGLATLDSISQFHPACLTDAHWLEGVRANVSERVSAIARDWRLKVPYVPAPVRSEKVGRNDPCPCGSGKKYKKCCAV